MKTEINGNWGAYIKRFQLPSKKCFQYPIRCAVIIFIAQLIASMVIFTPFIPFAKFLILFFVLMTSVFFYIKVHYQEFWNKVLEESKGFFADLIMWVYYMLICCISICPTFIAMLHLNI